MKNDTLRQRHRWFWIGFFIILAVAGFFRLWQLHAIPPGLFGDEAADALDALDVLAGRGQVFFPANFGREGLHMWILAGTFKLMGLSPYAIRLPSALAGIATALAAYWLGYELFIARLPKTASDRQFRTAWLIAFGAGLFTAISYWHIHFSRFGIRGVFTTMMAAFTMAALWRGIHQQRWRWYALAGLFMGIGAHFYTASRFIPLFLGIFLGGWLLLSWLHVRLDPPIVERRTFVIGAILLFAISALVFAPLGYYFLTHPGSFTQRAGEVSAFKDGFSLQTAQVIGKAAALNILQFIWPHHGDMARFYNLPGRAVFMPLTALLALLGVAIAIKRWRQPVYSFLLLWFLIMASPSFLAVDRAPTLPRVLGVIPGVFFFPAIGLATLLDWLTSRSFVPSERVAAGLFWGLAALAFLTPGIVTYRDYFLVWGPSPETEEAFEVDMTTAWRWLTDHPPSGPLYVSADIYRHPSFILLYEQVPTTEYFTRVDPNLHWFDARRSWPMLPPNQDATIIVGDSAQPPEIIQNLLGIDLQPIGNGAAFLAHTSFYVDEDATIWFSPELGLVSQQVLPPDEPNKTALILQIWRTRGPHPDEIAPRQIQSALLAANGEQIVQVSDDMGIRAPEWREDGLFITWQTIPWPSTPEVAGTALRVVPHGRPPLQPDGSEDGWVSLPLQIWKTP